MVSLKITLITFFVAEEGFPDSSFGKESACNGGDPSLIPGLERSSGEGNCNPLQYSHLENAMDRGVWWVAVYGIVRVGHNLATKPSNYHHAG